MVKPCARMDERFPNMFKADAEPGKGWSEYYPGSGSNQIDKSARNRAKRFEVYARGSKKITEFFKAKPVDK